MNCFSHSDKVAIAICTGCGKGLCSDCCLVDKEVGAICSDECKRLRKRELLVVEKTVQTYGAQASHYRWITILLGLSGIIFLTLGLFESITGLKILLLCIAAVFLLVAPFVYKIHKKYARLYQDFK